MNPALRHFLETALAAKIQARRGWRAPARIKRFDGSLFRRVEKTKGIAADADRTGLDNTEHRGSSNRRVNRIANVASGWLDATMPFLATVENTFLMDPRRDYAVRLARFENLRIDFGRLIEILHLLWMHHVTLVAAKQPGGFRFDVIA
jgi:hypothetical protein